MNVEGVVNIGTFSDKSGEALQSIWHLNPSVVIIQEESLLFQGLATELREQGINVLGADAGPSILEQDKAAARNIIRTEFPILLPKTLLEISGSNSGQLLLPDQCVVRTRQVSGANTTVIVTDELSKQRALKLAENAEVLVEEFVEGTQLTYYIFTDNKTTYISPPLRTYPFRADQDQGEKTGGMGCATVQNIGVRQGKSAYPPSADTPGTSYCSAARS